MSPLTSAAKQTISQHVLNLTSSQIGTSNLSRDLGSVIRELLDVHLANHLARGGRDVVVIASGGLEDDRSAVRSAAEGVDFWLDNGVYPIYLVWEPGFLDSLMQSVLPNMPYSRPPRFEPEEGDTMWGQLVNRTMEKVARGPGMIFWERMHENAREACAPSGAMALFVDSLKGVTKRFPSMRLHAMGHSAGTILLTHFFSLCRIEDLPPFATAHYLAPAVPLTLFRSATLPLIGPSKGIERLTVFLLPEAEEEQDLCEWKGVVGYHRSFLYWVHTTFERDRSKLLGLDIHIREDDQIRSRVEFVFADPHATGELACTAKSHIDFERDPATLSNLVRRISGQTLLRTRPLVPPAAVESAGNGHAPLELAPMAGPGMDKDRVADLLRAVANLIDGGDARAMLDALLSETKEAA